MRPVWQVRHAARSPDEVQWNILQVAPPPELPRGAVILNLAGSTKREAGLLAEHATLASVIADAAVVLGARHILHVSSAAVYGLSADDHPEDEPPAPQSAYGRAKADAERTILGQVPVTLLRIGNIAGADALLGNAAAELLIDPVAGQSSGPVRSYIGPQVLSRVLAAIARCAALGMPLPRVVNIAQGPAVGMADLAHAAGRNWRWGAENPDAVPRVGLSITRLVQLYPDLPGASATSLVADLAEMRGMWP